MNASANWQLPPGVSRAVWDVAHDSTAAEGYDAALAGTPLLIADLQFVRRHVKPRSRVIDLGCGTGRAAIALARDGHRVVGVDLSQPMLRVARRKPGGESVAWMPGNIVELRTIADATFDAAICLFSTLGMVAGKEARQRTVHEAWRLLEPGGVFLLHMHLLGHHLSTRAGRRLWLADVAQRFTRRPDAGDFLMPPANGLPGWVMHLFTVREARRLLQDAGFRIDKLEFVGIDGQPISGLAKLGAYGLLIAARKSDPTGGETPGKLN